MAYALGLKYYGFGDRFMVKSGADCLVQGPGRGGREEWAWVALGEGEGGQGASDWAGT